MGNCLMIHSSSSSSMVWAGDDWGSVTEVYKNSNDDVNGDERQKLLGDYQEKSPSSLATGSIREVKIKLTKRELEELKADAQMQGLTMEQVLARLVNNYNYEDNYEQNNHNYYSHHDHHHHHWKPALQSIPEVN